MRDLFFNDTATTEIYTLSLHDALPISSRSMVGSPKRMPWAAMSRLSSITLAACSRAFDGMQPTFRQTPPSVGQRSISTTFLRSEEHTSELQSRQYLVCRLLLEKKHYT